MNAPRFQFTIRGMLWATFWVAVSAGSWACFTRFLPLDGNSVWHLAVFYFAGLASAFAAVGAIFRRTVGGIVAGIVLAAFLLPIVFWAIWLPP
jgi:hypothetical protein